MNTLYEYINRVGAILNNVWIYSILNETKLLDDYKKSQHKEWHFILLLSSIQNSNVHSF